MALDKNSLSNISSYLFDEFLKHSDKYKTVSYFRRSPGGSLLMFKIMHSYFLNKDLHVEELIKKTKDPELKAFAQKIIKDQKAEIKQMQDILKKKEKK